MWMYAINIGLKKIRYIKTVLNICKKEWKYQKKVECTPKMLAISRKVNT